MSLLFSQTQSVIVTNTTAETSLLGTGVGDIALSAHRLGRGGTLRLFASGIYSTKATLPGTLTIRFTFDTIELPFVMNPCAYQFDQPWRIGAEFVQYKLGGRRSSSWSLMTNGTSWASVSGLMGHGWLYAWLTLQELQSPAITVGDGLDHIEICPSVIDRTPDLTVEWESADAANSIECYQAYTHFANVPAAA